MPAAALALFLQYTSRAQISAPIVPVVRELNHSECAVTPACAGTMPEAHLNPSIMFVAEPKIPEGGHPKYFEDAPIHFTAASHVEWGVDLIDQRVLKLDGLPPHFMKSGNGTVVYILDTGVNCGELPAFWKCVVDEPADDYPESVHGDPPGCRCDKNGHGTAMAHVASQLAVNATLVSVPVLDAEGKGSLSRLLFGLGRILALSSTAYADRPGIVLAALSTPPLTTTQLEEGAAALVDQALAALKAANVAVVVSAGNDGADACYVSPAHSKHAVAVAALLRNGRRAHFSNWGPCTDVFAPADSEALGRVYAGTSVSAAYAVGVAATIASEANLMAWQVVEAMLANASAFAIKKARGVAERHVYAPRKSAPNRRDAKPAVKQPDWRIVTVIMLVVLLVAVSAEAVHSTIHQRKMKLRRLNTADSRMEHLRLLLARPATTLSSHA